MQPTHPSDDLIGQRQQRIEIIHKLRELGIDPYPAHAQKDAKNQTIHDEFEQRNGKKLNLTGRVMTIRKHGKIIFYDIQDESGAIQICVKKDTYTPSSEVVDGLKATTWEQLSFLDVGDFMQVYGEIGKTKSEQITLFAEHIYLLSKSIRPLPNTLLDKEQKFRRRYLDLTLHPEEKARFIRKAKFWKVTREYLADHGFIEVETPVLEHVTGGADARPFATHHNELDQDFYLRISTELYQKRLIGAGFEKIYTFGPNFRNEGLSDEHLQEYYQMEWYWAYASYEDNMKLTQDMFRHIAREVYGETKFTSRGHTFDLADEWKRIDYVQVIQETFGVDIFTSTEKEMQSILHEKGVELTGIVNRSRLIDNLWKLIRKTIAGPAFLINEPAFLSPLSKSRTDDPRLTERYHVLIGGSELANGYSEINDPVEQLNRFLDQQKLREQGDDEAQMLDIDFVEMLEYGMPPTSGHGHSERLFWFLEDCTGREGTLFPLLRREFDQNTLKLYPFLKQPEKHLYEDIDNSSLLSIAPAVQKKWPTINLGFAIIKNVTVKKLDAKLEEKKNDLLDSLANLTQEQINAFPEVQSYRKMYKEMGVDWHSRRPSPEALLRRIAQKKGVYTVNTCVDAYNMVVVKHRVSSGAFDLDKIEFPTILQFGKEGDAIHLLGDSDPTALTQTEVSYFDQEGPFNLDFNYRDSQRTAVSESTKNILINIDGVYEISRSQVERTLKETIEIIQKYCGGTVEVAGIVSASV
ncbi:lysine--tRNA ligase [Candidatus Woesebacteria bacterium]|nr:lysine--tRNA ligase [Candidatus Woesebacteria bacterium]